MARRSAILSHYIAATMVLGVLTSAALAQQPDSKNTPRVKAAKSHKVQKPKPVARRAATPCSEYGAGFVRMAGSDTCVRIGGSVDVGVGFGVGVGR